MKCIEVEKQIDSLFDGEVNSVIRKEVEHHVQECRNCGQTFEKLRAVNELLMKPVPVPDPKRLDGLVMDAFYRHHQHKQEIRREKVNWWTVLSKLSLRRETAAVLTTLLFVVLLGLAFQLGRITATEIQVILPQTETVSQPASPVETTSGIKNETPGTKFIKVPIIKEKIVNRIVYVDTSRNKVPSVKSARNNLALKSSMRDNAFLTEVNLKGFQTISDAKTRIIKKGEIDEK